MRRALLMAALTIAASCGGSPMAPSANASPQPTSSLPSGAYLLTVMMSTNGSSGFSWCVSATINGQPSPLTNVSASTPVQLDHSGNTLTVMPDDSAATFRMQLQQTGAALLGTASGQFQSSATTINVSGTSSNDPAVAIATVGPSSVAGGLTGTVTVDPGLSCTNNGHTWILAPR